MLGGARLLLGTYIVAFLYYGLNIPELVLVGRCIILQSASGRFLSKRKAFLVPGCGTWTLKYLATQKVTHIVLPSLPGKFMYRAD